VKAATETQPGPTRSKSGVATAQRLKAGAGDDQQQGTEGQATSPPGRQPAAQEQVGGPRHRTEEQAGEHDKPDRAVDGDAAHNLFGLGDPALGVGSGGHRQQPHHQPPASPGGQDAGGGARY
jgi:hypothetical protein